MNDPGWDRIVDAIDSKFGTTDHGSYDEPLEDNRELKQHISFICFEKAGRTYRVERIARPGVVDRKSHYHRAAGSGVRFENIYDPNSTSFRTQFYIKDGDDWRPIEPDELSL
jgi:hypothetical protein